MWAATGCSTGAAADEPRAARLSPSGGHMRLAGERPAVRSLIDAAACGTRYFGRFTQLRDQNDGLPEQKDDQKVARTSANQTVRARWALYRRISVPRKSPGRWFE